MPAIDLVVPVRLLELPELNTAPKFEYEFEFGLEVLLPVDNLGDLKRVPCSFRRRWPESTATLTSALLLAVVAVTFGEAAAVAVERSR